MRPEQRSANERALKANRTRDRRCGQWQRALAAPFIHSFARKFIAVLSDFIRHGRNGCQFVYAGDMRLRRDPTIHTHTHIEESVALRQLYSCVFAVAWVCGCEFIYAFINQLTKCKFCIFHTRKKLNEMCEGGCVSEPARL